MILVRLLEGFNELTNRLWLFIFRTLSPEVERQMSTTIWNFPSEFSLTPRSYHPIYLDSVTGMTGWNRKQTQPEDDISGRFLLYRNNFSGERRSLERSSTKEVLRKKQGMYVGKGLGWYAPNPISIGDTRVRRTRMETIPCLVKHDTNQQDDS